MFQKSVLKYSPSTGQKANFSPGSEGPVLILNNSREGFRRELGVELRRKNVHSFLEGSVPGNL